MNGSFELAGSFITAIYRPEIHFDQGNFRNCAARLTEPVGQVSTGYRQQLRQLPFGEPNNLEELYTDGSLDESVQLLLSFLSAPIDESSNRGILRAPTRMGQAFGVI